MRLRWLVSKNLTQRLVNKLALKNEVGGQEFKMRQKSESNLSSSPRSFWFSLPRQPSLFKPLDKIIFVSDF
jgi:hypothetical protein